MVGTRVIEETDTFVEISTGGRTPVRKSDTDTKTDPGDPDVQNKRAVELTDLLQVSMDTRIAVTDLPFDEETIGLSAREMQNRFRGRMFFEVIDTVEFLVSREDIVLVTWNGEKFITSIRSIR